MRKFHFFFLLTIVVGISLLFTKSYLSLGSLEKLKNTYNCEDGVAAMMFLTKKSTLLIGGTKDYNLYADVLKLCKKKRINSLKQCEPYSDATHEREHCISTLAIQAKNETACENDNLCLLGYVAVHPENCDKYKGSLRNSCLWGAAYKSKDISFCNKIEETSVDGESCLKSFEDFDTDKSMACYLNRYKCIWMVSDNKNKLSLCEKLPPSTEKDLCNLTYALKNHKSSVCKKISPTSTLSSTCSRLVDKPLSEEEKQNGILNTLEGPI